MKNSIFGTQIDDNNILNLYFIILTYQSLWIFEEKKNIKDAIILS